MEHDELLKLIGEQTLLIKRRQELQTQINQDKHGLLSLYNSINSSLVSAGWLGGGIELLQRLDASLVEIAETDRRIAALKELTGV